MITINETKETITFIENGNEIKQIKRASRNSQYCFVKKMGIDSFDWNCNDYAKKLKVGAEKYINVTPAKKEPKEQNMESQVSEEPVIAEEKVTSEANVATEETFNSTVVESDGSVKIFSSSAV